MKIVCISDTHMMHYLFKGSIPIPECDVLIHAGDASGRGRPEEIVLFADWLRQQPAQYKVFVPGNHDVGFELAEEQCVSLLKEHCPEVIYLRDMETTIGGFSFYGSPWQPRFFNWGFNLDRGPALAEKWAKIPDHTQVLITHGPPKGIGDMVPPRAPSAQAPDHGGHVGCEDLLRRVANLDNLRLHVFGHIHSGYGVYNMLGREHTTHGDGYDTSEYGCLFVNASICSERYRPEHKPIEVLL